MKKTKDIIKQIKKDLDRDIYDMDEVNDLNDNDMITAGEAGFMKGYLEA